MRKVAPRAGGTRRFVFIQAEELPHRGSAAGLQCPQLGWATRQETQSLPWPSCFPAAPLLLEEGEGSWAQCRPCPAEGEGRR